MPWAKGLANAVRQMGAPTGWEITRLCEEWVEGSVTYLTYLMKR